MEYKKRILIVDDEENVRQLLEKVLKKEGYLIDTANNGDSALDKIEKSNVDIVITDINMPEMDGIELLKQIVKLGQGIKVILITAFATLDTAVEALRFGACDYITKPFDLDEILLSVKKNADTLNCLDNDTVSLISTNNELIQSKSPSMVKVIKLINQVADTNSTVLIQGETGTGKELIAQALHQLSKRSSKAFIKINCTAIPETLLESELFGYEKGAFTGAINKKPGRFELADGGTLFLDEIGDLPLSIQVKLLRAIQEKEFERLGGLKTVKSDVRIITATNKDLEKAVKDGNFREDLFYRLNVVQINLPSLKERKEDIPDLIKYFLKKSSDISGKPLKSITPEVLTILLNYKWQGNIRELENVIERCVVVTSGLTIEVSDLPEKLQDYTESGSRSDSVLDNYVDNAECRIIQKALKECQGNRTKASELLGISRRSLHRKIIKYQLQD